MERYLWSAWSAVDKDQGGEHVVLGVSRVSCVGGTLGPANDHNVPGPLHAGHILATGNDPHTGGLGPEVQMEPLGLKVFVVLDVV